MGGGKGTIGRLLAQKTERFFLDTDALIEARANKTIAEIFALEGEAAFREKERRLARWLADSVSGAAIACGGGMPASCENLRSIGEVIYLKCDFQTIAKRLEAESERKKRPLAASIERLRELFILREPIYERAADRVIDAAQSVEAVLEAIV
jgi:shikimate kinase